MVNRAERGSSSEDEVQEKSELEPAEKEALKLANELKDKILNLEATRLKPGESIAEILVDRERDPHILSSDPMWSLHRSVDYDANDKVREGAGGIVLLNNCRPITRTIPSITRKDIRIGFSPDGVESVSYSGSCDQEKWDDEIKEEFTKSGMEYSEVVGVGNVIVNANGEKDTSRMGSPKLLVGELKRILDGINGIKIEREEKVEK